MQSDHKPIFALFKVPTKIIETTAMSQIENKLLEDISKQRHESIPKIKLNKSEFHFQKIYYKNPQETNLDITNTGKSFVVFSIIYDKTASWLDITPLTGSVSANGSCSVTIKVLFKEKEAQYANYHTKLLHAYGKIRIVDGCDYNIEIHAEFLGSCFGCNFTELAKALGPVVDLPGTIKDNALTFEGRMKMPKELFRIVEFIKSSSLEGIFDTTPDPNVVQDIRFALDTLRPFNDRADSPAMIKVFIELLESMPKPLVSSEVIDFIAANEGKDIGNSGRNGVFCKFDPIDMESFYYIIDFLKWLVMQNKDWIHYVVGMFMYPLMHIERVEFENLMEAQIRFAQVQSPRGVSDIARKKTFINLIQS